RYSSECPFPDTTLFRSEGEPAISPGAADHHQCQRRVAAGDHDEDRGMVQPAEARLPGDVMGHVVEGRAGQHGKQAKAVDAEPDQDRKSTRLNSSHVKMS